MRHPAPLLVTLGAAFLLACGPSKDLNTPEAVRQAVIEHLEKRGDLNMSSMAVNVSSVSFREKEADATVSIQLLDGEAGQGMRMHYKLEQKDGEWVVKERSADSQSQDPHGAATPGGSLPSGHPPVTPAPPTQ